MPDRTSIFLLCAGKDNGLIRSGVPVIPPPLGRIWLLLLLSLLAYCGATLGFMRLAIFTPIDIFLFTISTNHSYLLKMPPVCPIYPKIDRVRPDV
jgi:hypothetical protein